MPDELNNAIPVPADGQAAAASVPGQPAEFAPPAGSRVVRDDDWNTLNESSNRNAERVRGMQDVFNAGSQAGFKTVDDFTAHTTRMKSLSDRGLDLDRLSGMFSPPEADEAPAGISKDDVAGMISEARTGWQKEQSWEKYNASRKAEGGVVDTWLGEVLGADASDELKGLVGNSARGYLESKRSLLPDDHPLSREALGFFDKDSAGEHLSKVAEWFASMKGGVLAGIGDAANKGGTTPTGSKPGGQGAPKTEPERDGRGARPTPSKEDIEAAFRQRTSARGQPASQRAPGV